MIAVEQDPVAEPHWEVHLDFIVAGGELKTRFGNPDHREGWLSNSMVEPTMDGSAP